MEGSTIAEIMPIVDMLIGMGAGMAAGPFMTKRIKRWRTRRKVSKMLNEIARNKREAKVEEQLLEN